MSIDQIQNGDVLQKWNWQSASERERGRMIAAARIPKPQTPNFKIGSRNRIPRSSNPQDLSPGGNLQQAQSSLRQQHSATEVPTFFSFAKLECPQQKTNRVGAKHMRMCGNPLRVLMIPTAPAYPFYPLMKLLQINGA